MYVSVCLQCKYEIDGDCYSSRMRVSYDGSCTGDGYYKGGYCYYQHM